MSFANNFYKNLKYSIDNLDPEVLKKSIDVISKTKKNKGRVFFLGSGGSAGNCSHAVNDFRKICNIEAYSPSDNTSELTARINDDGWDKSYSGWLKVSKLNSKDLIIIMSVGGGSIKRKLSLNLIDSIKLAKIRNCKIISIIGKNDGYAYKNSDLCIITKVIDQRLITPINESMQAVIWHFFVSSKKLQANKTMW